MLHFDDINKISESLMNVNHSAKSKAILTKIPMQPERIYIFYLCFALDIIHADCLDRKTPPKKKIYSSKIPFFRSFNLETLLLFEEILNLMSY